MRERYLPDLARSFKAGGGVGETLRHLRYGAPLGFLIGAAGGVVGGEVIPSLPEIIGDSMNNPWPVHSYVPDVVVPCVTIATAAGLAGAVIEAHIHTVRVGATRRRARGEEVVVSPASRALGGIRRSWERRHPKEDGVELSQIWEMLPKTSEAKGYIEQSPNKPPAI